MSERLQFLPREQEALAEEFVRQLGRVVYVEDMFPSDPSGMRELRHPTAPKPGSEILREVLETVA